MAIEDESLLFFGDDTGKYMGTSALEVDDLTDPEMLEAMAYNEADSLALGLNVQQIQVSTNCLATL